VAYVKRRLSLVEYGTPVNMIRDIATAIDGDRNKASSLITEVGIRIASNLGLSYNPITVDAKGVRAIDFAGLIRLAPSLELEVAPKFLGLDEADGGWREDFFFLAMLSRHGQLLTSEHLSASGKSPRDLSTLVARSFTSMYEVRKRRPIRNYRKVKEVDFYLDGDPDPLDIVFPSPDGFEQETLQFDRVNNWNASIVAAAKALLPEIGDPSVVRSLVRLIEDLSPQKAPVRLRKEAMPARHKSWRPIHDLSVDVINGLGLNYKQGRAQAPGYLVSTWRVWEDLITVALRLGFGRSAVVPQRGFTLGTKLKITGSAVKLSVFPDCVIEAEGSRPKMLLDAKYKGHVEKGPLRISGADIYEALAFSRAAACNLVILAYPAPPDGCMAVLGKCNVFERINIDNIQIVGIQIECRTISKRHGLEEFSRAITTTISNGLFF
jgi:5-methylcytosine-specific restriction enzyme subunit McrC